MGLLRRKKKQSLPRRLLQLWTIVRLGVRLQRAYRRGYFLLRAAALLAITGVVVVVIQRRRARALESQFTYAPPPSPSVTPGAPPLDASPNGGATTTETERNLSAEKDD